tara:strand:- start:11 stop:550 length:540 start_codon:yes stop_codon:yes gene_type:complete
MKAFFLLLPLLIINSCKTTTDTNSASQTNTTATEEVQTKVECPADGICTAEIQQSKKLIIKEDGTGALYPEISSGDNMVVIYTFSQKGPEGTVDGDYSETIHFEMPANASELDKKGNSLQDIKLLYGKQCYCKGEAGFYKVENGSLQVTKNRNELHFELQFAVDKTSHKLSKISKTIEM